MIAVLKLFCFLFQYITMNLHFLDWKVALHFLHHSISVYELQDQWHITPRPRSTPETLFINKHWLKILAGWNVGEQPGRRWHRASSSWITAVAVQWVQIKSLDVEVTRHSMPDKWANTRNRIQHGQFQQVGDKKVRDGTKKVLWCLLPLSLSLVSSGDVCNPPQGEKIWLHYSPPDPVTSMPCKEQASFKGMMDEH